MSTGSASGPPGPLPSSNHNHLVMFRHDTDELAQTASAGSGLLLAEYMRHHFSAERGQQYGQPSYEWGRQQHAKMLSALLAVVRNPYLELFLHDWARTEWAMVRIGERSGMHPNRPEELSPSPGIGIDHLDDAEHMARSRSTDEPFAEPRPWEAWEDILRADMAEVAHPLVSPWSPPTEDILTAEMAEVATPLVSPWTPPTSTSLGRPWNPPTDQPTTAETQIGAEDQDVWCVAIERLVKDECWHQEHHQGAPEEIEQRRARIQALDTAVKHIRIASDNRAKASRIVLRLEKDRIRRIHAALKRRRGPSASDSDSEL